MREIRFRAWDGKEMHENISMIDGEAIKHGYHGTAWTDKAKAGIPMQYTGLTDKNGKEIYEGDIVKVFYSTVDGESHSSICVVDSLLNYNFMCGLDHSDEIIIIGNIYENPELLEEEK